MKTVIDAVNDLMADAESGDYTANVRWPEYGYLGFDEDEDWVACARHLHNRVCSIEEFDQCVKEMSEAKWIPEKPVFTQAMADAGELPPVGSDFLHNGEVVLCISTTSHDGGVVTFRRLTQGNGPDIACCWNNKSWVKPIDTRTPKQKSVDEMIKSLETFENEFVQLNEYEAGKLYDLGYRKC